MHNDDGIETGERIPVLVAEHRVLVLVIMTILIALVCTGVGLFLYNVSGTAQLDLSRPDYEGVGEIVEQNKETYVEYSASGPIDKASLEEFDRLYGAQVENISSVDAFGGDPMALDSLGIDSPSHAQDGE